MELGLRKPVVQNFHQLREFSSVEVKEVENFCVYLESPEIHCSNIQMNID